MTPATEKPNVSGLSLDGTEQVVISAAENAELCAAMGIDPDPNGAAHPSFYFPATQVGMGLSVAELCRACDFDVADGPMLASSSVHFARPLMVDVPYRVRGEIRALTEKSSRKLGRMDLLDYVLRLETLEGALVCETANLWVLPRGAA